MPKEPNISNSKIYTPIDKIKVSDQWLHKLDANGFFFYETTGRLTFSQWMIKFNELNPDIKVTDLTLSFLENGVDQGDNIAELYINGFIFPIRNGYVLYSNIGTVHEMLFIADDSKRLEGLKAMRGLMIAALIRHNYEPYTKKFLIQEVAKLYIV